MSAVPGFVGEFFPPKDVGVGIDLNPGRKKRKMGGRLKTRLRVMWRSRLKGGPKTNSRDTPRKM